MSRPNASHQIAGVDGREILLRQRVPPVGCLPDSFLRERQIELSHESSRLSGRDFTVPHQEYERFSHPRCLTTLLSGLTPTVVPRPVRFGVERSVRFCGEGGPPGALPETLPVSLGRTWISFAVNHNGRRVSTCRQGKALRLRSTERPAQGSRPYAPPRCRQQHRNPFASRYPRRSARGPVCLSQYREGKRRRRSRFERAVVLSSSQFFNSSSMPQQSLLVCFYGLDSMKRYILHSRR